MSMATRRKSLEPNIYSQWRYRLIGWLSVFVFGFAWVLLMDLALRVS